MGERIFLAECKKARLPAPEEEYKFHPSRKWRFDFAWPDKMLAVEIEGGSWSGGRHTRGSGFEKDCEKYSTAAAMGWRIMRFTTGQVENGLAIGLVKEAI